MPSIAILGPGGVGGFLAAALERSGAPVTLVAPEATAELIAREGITLRSVRLGNVHVHPRAVARLEEPVDVLFVAPKATALDAALDRLGSEPGVVVPLLNGVEHLAALRARLTSPVAAGAIRIESDRPAPGRIVQTSPFLRVDLVAEDPALRPSLEELADVLEAAEVPTRLCASEAAVMWGKLVRLNALACTTSAVDAPLGFIRADAGWRAALEGCVREGAAVAAAEGADVMETTVIAELEAAHATLGSSMQRDIAAGREPELDAIAGAVLRAGARHGLSCPTIARLSARIAERADIAPPRA